MFLVCSSQAATSNISRRSNQEALMALDVPLLRSETPGVANVLHFNNAGMALPPRTVLDAVTRYMAREAAIGGMAAMVEADDRIADFYDAIAPLTGAHPDRVPSRA